MRTGAGALDRRLRFEKRADVADGYGNTVGAWEAQFACWAGLKHLRGGETVIAGRLAGRRPAIATIRNGVMPREITNEWRAVDERTGEIYNIREDPREMDGNRGYLEMLVESGVAV
ncbi:MAG: phage head closure protein [Mesorhizobium sp.]